MKKIILLYAIGLLLVTQQVVAQKDSEALNTVKECINNYRALSVLGNSVLSTDLNQDKIDEFRMLFRRDASLCWDLYKTTDDTMKGAPLSLEDYIDRVRYEYLGKQPKLNIPEKKIGYQMSPDNRSCIVYMVKENRIEETRKKFTIRLRVNVQLVDGTAQIMGIQEDKRNTRLRAITPAAYYAAYDNVTSSLSGNPLGTPSPKNLDIVVSPQLWFGMGADIRLNNEIRDGIVVNAGVYIGQSKFDITADSLGFSYLDVVDSTSSSQKGISLTVFDRAYQLTEKVALTSIHIPIGIKKYFKPFVYAKAGVEFSMVSGTLTVEDFLVSHTGGGRVTNLNNPSQYFDITDPDDEITGVYGFFAKQTVKGFSHDYEVNKMNASLMLAIGLEKQFGSFSLGIEPYCRIGSNALHISSVENSLDLLNTANYKGMLSLVETPSYRMNAGIGFFVSYLFRH
jgi:hypothetical protein